MTNNHPENQITNENLPPSDKTRRVADFCRKIIDLLGFQLTVKVHEQDRTVLVDISGADQSELLFNSAAVLNSLEYLANKSFRSGKTGEICSIIIDSDNYRQHREAELILLAKMASQKVISQRRPLVLQPMTPKERRIVHLALAEIEGVRSESDGTGDHRSVTIFLSE